MHPPRHSRPDLNLNVETAPPGGGIPQALFDELAAAVRGPVLRPSDPEYAERAKTFNGRLEPRCRMLVSPLDAQDTSAVVKFCLKHSLSPSVRAGGYGIAGWAVAGDVVVDMSMMRDIEIERPLAEEDVRDGVDWVRMRDMLPPNSKGKGRAGGAAALPATAVHSSSPATATATATGKRRRDDRSPSPSLSVPDTNRDEMGSSTGRGQFDDASHAVASFLRGPPLPPVPGETPRQPPENQSGERPTNRPRRHSPRAHSPTEPDLPPSSAVPQRHVGGRALPLPLAEDGRQLSGDSTQSSGSSSRFSTQTGSTALTSPDPASSPPSSSDPFSYLSGGSRPDGPLVGAPALGVSAFTAPPVAGGSGVGGWNPGFGTSPAPPGFAMPSFSSPFPFPVPGTSSQPSLSASQSQSALPTPMPILPGRITDFALAHAPTISHANARPVHPHAYVTFGAGLRQKEVDLYTAEHPLEALDAVTGDAGIAVPYHVPMSAHPVGSSIMLLAGFGFISRMYGLSVDNLVELEMVLADGRIVNVSAESDPDLWWAIRGAGPAFGIATRYKVRAFPVPVVFAGNLIYRFHRATAASLIKHFRDCIKGAPRELYANVLLTAGPADKDSLVVIQICYLGPKEKGVEYLQAIASWEGEKCLLNEVNEKSFLNQQDSVAQILRGRAGRQWFLRSSLITSLPDELVNRTVLEFADTPLGCTWIFELAGGAIGDFEDTCIPKEQRAAAWTVAALHQWDIGIDDPRCVETAEEWMKNTIKPSSVGGPFPTFLGRHESVARTKACFGTHWDRLAQLKRRYDPRCLLRNTFWPLDEHGEPVGELHNEPPSPAD